jgi:hypothetical protein
VDCGGGNGAFGVGSGRFSTPPLQRRGSETWSGAAGPSRNGVVSEGKRYPSATTPLRLANKFASLAGPSSEEEGLTIGYVRDRSFPTHRHTGLDPGPAFLPFDASKTR